jgi:hypothetical protein
MGGGGMLHPIGPGCCTHSAPAGWGPVAHSRGGGRCGHVGSGTAGLLPAGSSLPMDGLSGNTGCDLMGPLASDMSDAAPISLDAARIDSRLTLMASHASLAKRVASVAMLAGWPTARFLLRAMISFLELPSCFPNPRRTVSSGSVSSLVAASEVYRAWSMAFLRGARQSVASSRGTGSGSPSLVPATGMSRFARVTIFCACSFHSQAVSGSSPSSLS